MSGMKMAKASEADLEASMKVCNALEAFEKGYWPEGIERDDENERFDADDGEHASAALHHLRAITARTSMFRVCFGMTVLLDPRNKMVDPTADTLEQHPIKRELLDSLQALEVFMPRDGEGANETFERVAEVFHRATGYLRPGKDCVVHSYEERSTAWDEWVAAIRANARAAIANATGAAA